MNCLACYQPLEAGERDFHRRCSRRLFGTDSPPKLDFDTNHLQEIALQAVSKHETIPGVQQKLSLHLQSGQPPRLTVLGLWGRYILKPQTERYSELPELEDLTMHLAAEAGILTAQHTLIRLQNGELAYLTVRFDRTSDERKLPQEDFCQLTERLTEDKYKGSHEQIGKVLRKYSQNVGLDAQRFYEMVLFNYLLGNADGHLKNYSLLTNEEGVIGLSPAYDLLPTKLVEPTNNEELALSLNGKKRRLKLADFLSLASSLQIQPEVEALLRTRLRKRVVAFTPWIRNSFVSTAYQEQLLEPITLRSEVLSTE